MDCRRSRAPEGQERDLYAWDAEGKAVTFNGTGQTFDALGRMVSVGLLMFS
ncbi:MAG: hypothetical protein ACRD1Y_08195 [Terriglobales bacterium]